MSITVVVPVYNVDRYLSECLESILRQTYRDIEVICVNDGSTDRSPQILEDYAAKDPRISIVHKKNGGLSSARNAAYPMLRGKYTLFIDSDDYVEHDLCEKVLTVAEREEADMTFYFNRTTSIYGKQCHLERFLKKRPFDQVDRRTLLTHMHAWSKLWKTSFLLNHDLRFPEGICFEDCVVHWKALQRNPKKAVVAERLYWYRYNPTSITGNTNSKRYFDVFPCYDKIKHDLRQAGNYEDDWKDAYLEFKLRLFATFYISVSRGLKPEMRSKILENYGDDERDFMRRSQSLPWYVTDFYKALEGSSYAKMKTAVNHFLIRIKRSIPNRIHVKKQMGVK